MPQPQNIKNTYNCIDPLTDETGLYNGAVMRLHGGGVRVAESVCVSLGPHLKDVLIQQTGAEDSDSVCADHGVVSAEQLQRLHLLAVQVQRDGLALDAVGDPVPPRDRGHSCQTRLLWRGRDWPAEFNSVCVHAVLWSFIC